MLQFDVQSPASPPPRVAASSRSNVAAPTTRLVGREGLLREVEADLAIHRCTTLTGPPGVGKTRLALEVVRRRIGEVPRGGVWMCDLVDARSLDGLCGVIAATIVSPLGPADGDGCPRARMGEVLRRLGPSWIVLDACEGIREVVAETLPAWLEVAPEVRFIITSRRSTGMVG